MFVSSIACMQELQRLSTLASLTDVHLRYGYCAAPTAAAAGWPALRGLHTLHLGMFQENYQRCEWEVSTTMLDAVCKLTWLTELVLCGVKLGVGVTAHTIAHGLKGLTSLKQLTLGNIKLTEHPYDGLDQSSRNAEALMQAIEGMNTLTSLTLHDLNITPTAAMSIARAVKLQRLVFFHCHLGDSAVTTLVRQLPELMDITADYDGRPRGRNLVSVTDATLSYLHLTKPYLSFAFRGIDDESERAIDELSDPIEQSNEHDDLFDELNHVTEESDGSEWQQNMMSDDILDESG